MRINHNISAMNSYRNFAANGSKLNKNLEKLSTGMKINRAGDDAAGLAISEKMRVQISGIEGATKNAKDGISLVQTAEGALTEVHDMLNRMVTLAEQSANGTYDNNVDRKQLQKEVDALKTEIDRIADSTNYNGIKLLDGSLSGTSGTAAASTIKLDINLNNIKLKDPESWEVSFTGAGTAAVVTSTAVAGYSVGNRFGYNFTYEENGTNKTQSIMLTVGQDKDGTQYLVGDTGTRYNITNNAITSVTEGDLKKAFDAEYRAAGLENSFNMTAGSLGGTADMKFDGREKGTSGARMKSVTVMAFSSDGTVQTEEKGLTLNKVTNASDAYYTASTPTLFTGSNQNEAEFSVNGQRYIMVLDSDADKVKNLDSGVTVIFGDTESECVGNAAAKISQDTGLNVTQSGGYGGDSALIFKAGQGTASKGGLTLQIGDTSDKFNKMTVSIEDMHAKSIGVGALNISTQEGAAQAINTIRDAVNFVSNTRGTLGALQNRLDHTINNLGVMRENIQSSESLIRDTDVAEEMMTYTKNNILNQSSQAMLAQANQLPQGVLQLLG